MRRKDNTPGPEQGGPENNNFFNQNPLLIFAIFSIVAILVFKYFAEDVTATGDPLSGGTSRTVKKPQLL